MAVVVDDDVVETLSPNLANQALYVRVLPWRPRGSEYLLDPEARHPAPKPRAVHAIPVPQEVARGPIPWERLDDLLTSPLARGVLGDVEMHHPTPLESQHDEDVKNSKRDGGDNEQIDASEGRSLILQKRPPTLGRWTSPADHVPGHRGQGDLDSQHEQFPMHPRRAPERILQRDAPD